MAEQKKKGKGAAGTAGIAALILLLAGGGYGVGRGQGMLPGEGDSLKPETEQLELVEQESAQEPADDGILTVRVSENQIYFEDEPMTAAELEEALLREYTEGTPVELVDDSAIKAGYDEAAAVLDKLGIEYGGR